MKLPEFIDSNDHRRLCLRKPAPTIVAIIAVSAAATLFLFWLIYVHPAEDTGNTRYTFLPALNAILNGLAATSLLIGYSFIRARRISVDRASMITAFVFSTLFLVSYIVHHALHGDVRYPAHVALRTLYLTLLTSHIVLAVVALPMVLVTFFFFAHRTLPASPKDCALDFSALALCLGHRCHHLRHAAASAGMSWAPPEGWNPNAPAPTPPVFADRGAHVHSLWRFSAYARRGQVAARPPAQAIALRGSEQGPRISSATKSGIHLVWFWGTAKGVHFQDRGLKKSLTSLSRSRRHSPWCGAILCLTPCFCPNPDSPAARF